MHIGDGFSTAQFELDSGRAQDRGRAGLNFLSTSLWCLRSMAVERMDEAKDFVGVISKLFGSDER